MTVINGKDVLVAIDDVPVFCGKDCAFSEEKELIKASTVTSGVWKEFRLRKRSWSMEVSGLTKIDNTDGQISYFNLIGSEAMNSQNFSIIFIDPDGNTQIISGVGYMQTTGIDGAANEFANATVSIIGDGLYQLESAACVPVGFDAFDFPDGQVGVPYDFTLPMTGTPPFARSGGLPVKPSWMIISSGSTVHCTGTPTDAGTFTVRFTISNCGGGSTVLIDKTITIT